MNTGIYIDDSGTTGLVSGSRFSSPNTKSWYAVVLAPGYRTDAEKFMDDNLKNKFKAKEFHFKDIYNRRNEFEGVSLNDRLEIIYLFATLFKEWRLPILCQTFSLEEYERNNLEKGSDIQKIDDFNLNNYSDFSLFKSSK